MIPNIKFPWKPRVVPDLIQISGNYPKNVSMHQYFQLEIWNISGKLLQFTKIEIYFDLGTGIVALLNCG